MEGRPPGIAGFLQTLQQTARLSDTVDEPRAALLCAVVPRMRMRSPVLSVLQPCSRKVHHCHRYNPCLEVMVDCGTCPRKFRSSWRVAA